ncbi:hypothetical protein P7C70_g1009, partial [Phenoliferia sp. Uapishka_3]
MKVRKLRMLNTKFLMEQTRLGILAHLSPKPTPSRSQSLPASCAKMSAEQVSRARSASLSQGLASVPLDSDQTASTTARSPKLKPVAAKLSAPAATVLSDLKSFRWTTNPATSLKLIVTTVALWAALEYNPFILSNPLSHALFISHPLPPLPSDEGITRYGKGFLDIAFLAFYIVVWSFIRQGVTEYILRPLAKWAGLKSDAKQVRATNLNS